MTDENDSDHRYMMIDVLDKNISRMHKIVGRTCCTPVREEKMSVTSEDVLFDVVVLRNLYKDIERACYIDIDHDMLYAARMSLIDLDIAIAMRSKERKTT